jgi:hypothetical protein
MYALRILINPNITHNLIGLMCIFVLIILIALLQPADIKTIKYHGRLMSD